MCRQTPRSYEESDEIAVDRSVSQSIGTPYNRHPRECSTNVGDTPNTVPESGTLIGVHPPRPRRPRTVGLLISAPPHDCPRQDLPVIFVFVTFHTARGVMRRPRRQRRRSATIVSAAAVATVATAAS